MKKCNGCKKRKSKSAFGKNKQTKDGLMYQCKDCNKARVSAYFKANPDKMRTAYSRHNLTLEQYTALAINGCAICGRMDNLRIDHDHSCCSGTHSCGVCVRGVLCQQHNTALGMFSDSIEQLNNAIKYLGSRSGKA